MSAFVQGFGCRPLEGQGGAFGGRRPMLRLHKGGRYRSEADMHEIYEYAP